MAKSNGKKILVARCLTHRRYTGEQKPKHKCDTCWLLYVLRWQHSGQGDRKLGGLNAFAYFIPHVNLEEACGGIKMLRLPAAQS